jgi:hypothetical protein
MTESYRIPIIARGRLIEPSEGDSVEFNGRGGASFVAPDPHKHIQDLILGNPLKLSRLRDTPMREIIDFLHEASKRMRLDDNPYLQDSFSLGLKAGGLSEPILRRLYETLPHMFEAKATTAMVDNTIGIDYLDGWVVSDHMSNVRIRAIGTRQLHITAGNVPTVAAQTIIRGPLTKSDILIKSPSNDPLTATALMRTLLELDASHPVCGNTAIAYWKGGDEFMDSQIVRTSRIDKITAWGGMSSVKHIQKFLTPGIDLTALNPKYSVSLLGKEALETDEALDEAAVGIAAMVGFYNQSACANTRIVYVESDTDDESIEKLKALGQRIVAAYRTLPDVMSTPAEKPNEELSAELEAVSLEDDFYTVIGDTLNGGVVISHFPDRVDFYDQLNNRVVNLVPLTNLLDAVQWCDDTTQTVGVYPESLRDELLDAFALAGVQRMLPMKGGNAMQIFNDIHTLPPGSPHDGIEPWRRSVRWVIDQRAPDNIVPLSVAAE